ncbi:ribonuclease HI [Caldalkalibacillus thermarum TA2.A1]|uniref:Ribonuclease H n=1 Tax=Caldalkalibacillus thermarum (strain TA2.A1) TaxID=986075 RepID=A0A8X8IAH5_CALTT|nr:ribonuclease HI [Caldalkalibacillus thermarum]QZT34714.1 ribonuclease HI [Caldalkalibacillus thermarum TA2.A1]
MKEVTIYTDGACSGNPGPWGWAAVLIYGQHVKELSGGSEYTTNQRMELTAAIEGLKALKEPCKVKLYSDSAYMVNGFQQKWYTKWEQNGWKNSSGQPVANKELWQALLELTRKHEVSFYKVKGHADNKWNNRCDQLAVAAIPK